MPPLFANVVIITHLIYRNKTSPIIRKRIIATTKLPLGSTCSCPCHSYPPQEPQTFRSLGKSKHLCSLSNSCQLDVAIAVASCQLGFVIAVDLLKFPLMTLSGFKYTHYCGYDDQNQEEPDNNSDY
jgi:hypothetical protein